MYRGARDSHEGDKCRGKEGYDSASTSKKENDENDPAIALPKDKFEQEAESRSDSHRPAES